MATLAREKMAEQLAGILREPLKVPSHASVLNALNLFKAHPADVALIVGPNGSLEGIVTQSDFLRAMAGDLEDEEVPESQPAAA